MDVHELEWHVEMAMEEMPHRFRENRLCQPLRIRKAEWRGVKNTQV